MHKKNPANPACPVKYLPCEIRSPFHRGIGETCPPVFLEDQRSELVRHPKAGKPLEHLTGVKDIF